MALVYNHHFVLKTPLNTYQLTSSDERCTTVLKWLI